MFWEWRTGKEETSNALFEELADWNKHLKTEKTNSTHYIALERRSTCPSARAATLSWLSITMTWSLSVGNWTR